MPASFLFQHKVDDGDDDMSSLVLIFAPDFVKILYSQF